MSCPVLFSGKFSFSLSGFAFKSRLTYSATPVGLPHKYDQKMYLAWDASKTYYSGPYHADYLNSTMEKQF